MDLNLTLKSWRNPFSGSTMKGSGGFMIYHNYIHAQRPLLIRQNKRQLSSISITFANSPMKWNCRCIYICQFCHVKQHEQRWKSTQIRESTETDLHIYMIVIYQSQSIHLEISIILYGAATLILHMSIVCTIFSHLLRMMLLHATNRPRFLYLNSQTLSSTSIDFIFILITISIFVPFSLSIIFNLSLS